MALRSRIFAKAGEIAAVPKKKVTILLTSGEKK